MTSDISSRRLAWLDGELSRWQSDGLIAPEEARAIRSRYRVSHRLTLTRVVLGLGAAFVAVGAIWLVAANLDRIPPTVRLAAVAALWLGLVAAAEAVAERRVPAGTEHASPLVGAARLLAAAAFGAVIFQAAQSLQVPAYSPTLVGYWAAGALLYAYAVVGLAPLALAVVVGTVWFVWQSVDGGRSSVDFVASVLLAAVFATAVGVVHAPARRVLGIAGWTVAPWGPRFADVWRLAAAFLALLGLFVAALPIYRDEQLRVDRLLLVALALTTGAVVAAVILGAVRDRVELAVAAAVLAAAGLLALWRPEGDLADPSPELTGRAVLSVLAYLVAAGWYALLGVRRELPGLTWLAAAALVVFTAVQSFAVFAPVISGAMLFLAVGLVLIAAGYLVDRGRRHLVRLGSPEDRRDGQHDQKGQEE